MRRKKHARSATGASRFSVSPSVPDVVEKMNADAIIASLSGILRGWEESGIADKLKIPKQELLVRRTDGSTLYSLDHVFSIAQVVNSFSVSGTPSDPFPSYGFAVCDTANTCHFIFVDASRKISVRQRISVLQPTIRQATWQDIAQTIAQAEEEAKKTGNWAVVNKEDL